MREDSKDLDNRSNKDKGDGKGCRNQCNRAVRARGNKTRDKKRDKVQQSSSFRQSRGNWYKDGGHGVDVQMRRVKEKMDASIVEKDNWDYKVMKDQHNNGYR